MMSQPGTGVTLSDEQNKAVEEMLSTDKRVTIVTGPAGCGKSTLINHLRSTGWYTVAATTGKAAMHVDGVTVDSLFCFNRDNWKIWNESYLEYVMRECADILIIEEASMIGRRMGNVIDHVCEDFKKRLLLFGDFAQAAPVKDGWITESKLMDDYNFIKLTECHRQNAGVYLDALNKVRVGTIDKSVEDVFRSCINPTPPDDDRFIRMFATNKKTNAYNNARLWRHVAEERCGHFRLFTGFNDTRPDEKKKRSPRKDSFINNAIEATNFAHGEALAPGCRVVITCNEPQERRYVNGDTGTLIGGMCIDGQPLEKVIADGNDRPKVSALQVRLDRTGQMLSVGRLKRKVTDPMGRYVQHELDGFPVRLGYAVTIHKAQGMTVPHAWVDMESLMRFPDDESRHGLAYVALSRTTSLEGLQISRWVPEAIHCSKEIRELL